MDYKQMIKKQLKDLNEKQLRIVYIFIIHLNIVRGER